MTTATTEKQGLTANDYQTAIDVQSACNASGVIHSLSRVMERVWVDVGAANGGTDQVNRHPIVILYLAQLVFLATGESLDYVKYSDAYGVCKDRAGE